ncbi:hypothetical protein BH09MYX1_BH09MYX1_37080 [soil metagenome]
MTCILDGRLVLAQPAREAGYRVNVDALHLARFAAPRLRGTVVDLGAGTGAVALAAALLAPRAPRRVVLVEGNPIAAALAEENARTNGVEAEIVCEDVVRAARTLRGEADVVLCNPPYFEPGKCRLRTVAPEARVGSLAQFVAVARTMLGHRGRFFFVYPAADFARALACLETQGLVAKRAQLVHGKSRSPARVVLMEACAGKPGGLVIEPPIAERP